MGSSSKRYRVNEHDNPFRFRVASQTRPDIEHVVDVSAHNGIGECTCEHFQFRLLPTITQRIASRQAHRCSHICAARERCLDSLIQKITGIESDQQETEEEEPT